MKFINKLLSVILVFVFFRHVYFLIQCFVDIPYRDSWQLIADHSFTPQWLFGFHNEHFILLSKLQVWLLYNLNSWNVVSHLWLNLFIYCLALTSLFVLFKDKAIVPAIFSLCSLNWENLSWEFQSCFHFYILFLVLTIVSLERKNHTSAVIFNFLMVCSFSAGVGAALALAIYNFRYNKKISLLLVVPCFVYLLKEKSSIVLDFRTLDFFLNLISFGFGYETYSWVLGLFCFLLIMIPLNYKKVKFTSSDALALSVFASLLLISIGRAGNPDLHIWSKGARYFEISSLLIYSGFVSWSVFPQKAKVFSSIFLILPFIGTLDNWDYSIYNWITEQKQIGRECMRNSDGQTFYCKTLWAEESSKQREIAKRLNLSFLD